MSNDPRKDGFGDCELEWDSTIENDSPEFILLPEGDYDFEVLKFERGRHQGSEKLPPCNKAVLSIRLTDPQNPKLIGTVNHNLFLHTSVEGMLCAFFTAIGQRSRGERVTMNWNAVTGAKGRCKVTIREWEYNGETKKGNQIQRFYEPDSAPAQAPSQGKYQAGKF